MFADWVTWIYDTFNIFSTVTLSLHILFMLPGEKKPARLSKCKFSLLKRTLDFYLFIIIILNISSLFCWWEK